VRPDIEPIIRDYLLAFEEITDLVDDRIADQSPEDVGKPWVRITLLPSPSIGVTDHFVKFNLQLDIFAGQDINGLPGECPELTRQVRGAMAEIHQHSHEGAVFSGAEVSDRRMPNDEEHSKPMVRYMISATVWGHAVAVGS
jgi:hypothetical protein